MFVCITYLQQDPLEAKIASHLMNDKEGHDAKAKEWTQRYAM